MVSIKKLEHIENKHLKIKLPAITLPKDTSVDILLFKFPVTSVVCLSPVLHLHIFTFLRNKIWII